MADADVVRAFQARQKFITDRVDAAIARAWAALPGYNEQNVATFLASVENVVPIGQQAMGTLVDAYMAQMSTSAPVGVPADVVTNLRGVDLTEAYKRPFLQLWRERGEGLGPYDDLVRKAGARAQKMAVTDQQMAMRAATSHVTERQPKIVGYRRVLTGKSCMFCATAATRRYKKSSLMPMHSGCDCGVAPIIGLRDPGEVINADLLDSLKEQGPDYWRKRGFVDPDGQPIDPTEIPPGLTEIDHHTEIGPVVQAA